jgi:hypothetical protein
MWKPFRKKDENRQVPRARQSPPRANRVDELANALQRDGRIRDLERELGKLDYVSLSVDEQESWWHLYGITAFQDGRHGEALARFQEGYRRFPTSAYIRFSLGQQYIRARAAEEGFALFRTCKFRFIRLMRTWSHGFRRFSV